MSQYQNFDSGEEARSLHREGSFSSNEEAEQNLQYFKDECRRLNNELIDLKRDIPHMKDAAGKDCTKKMMDLFSSELKMKAELEETQRSYQQLGKEFAQYKQTSNKHLSEMERKMLHYKELAETEERDNKKLHDILKRNGIRLLDETTNPRKVCYENIVPNSHPNHDIEKGQSIANAIPDPYAYSGRNSNQHSGPFANNFACWASFLSIATIIIFLVVFTYILVTSFH